MSRGYYNSRTPFLYTSGNEPGGGGGGGAVGPTGMDCLQLRQPPGPFHYLINEQAKSLVALQELQHEVGALLEFRDLVIETFPNLRTKLAATTTSTPTTMLTTPTTNLNQQQQQLINLRGTIVNNPTNDWTPGVRVRKKLGTMKEKKISGDNNNTSTIQDSGFSTETSSKETHSASSTTVNQSTTIAGIDETEDELWNLLDVIHRKGTRLKDEVEALQGVLKQQQQHSNNNGGDFQQLLYNSGGGIEDDLRQLRQERDLLLDRLAEMEAEVLAGRVHTSRLQEDLENLLIAKHDLEEQLKILLQHSDQVNTRINDMHLEFITKQSSTSQRFVNHQTDNNDDDDDGVEKNHLDRVLGEELVKIKVPDREKIAAILTERDPIILQKHLLNSTVQNQVLHQQLDTATRLEIGLADKLDKAREENDELRFQLEDKNIELEGTRARVRMLEQLQKSLTTEIINDNNQHVSRNEITTASMKAMSPLPMNLQIDHSSSTESAHDQAETNRKLVVETITKRKPSKIPLKSYTAPKPPNGGGKNNTTTTIATITTNTTTTTTTTTRSRSSGESPASRPHSAQSWRNRSSDGNIIINNNNNSLSGSKSNNSLTTTTIKSRNGSLVTSKDSLSNKLRNSDSLTKLSNNSFGNNRNSTLRKTTTPNKWNSNSVGGGNNGGNGGNNTKDLINEKINLNSIKEKSQFPWTHSSYDDSYQSSYLDSLDKQPTTSSSNSNNYQTTNTFLWNVNDDQFYDSIDSNLASCIEDYDVADDKQQNRELTECDSLEDKQ